MWYNINFERLVLLVTPSFLQKGVVNAYIRAVIQPIKKVYDNWSVYRTERLVNLAHNGQVCYLRKIANDKLDSVGRDIRITNGNQYERIYIFTPIEKRPVFLDTTSERTSDTLFLHSTTDYVDTGVDFIVSAPRLLVEQKYALEALINEYKQDVKRYKTVAQ